MSNRPLAAALLVAGGSGERFGREGGKQLAPVAGWPVLSWSLRALEAVPQVSLLVVVCPEGRHREYQAEAVDPLGLSTPVRYAASGRSRQASVAAGLAVVPDEIEFVIVHDGARPLVTPDLVERTLAAVASSDVDGAVVGHPSYDTLKLVDGGRVVETVDRTRFWAIQTPQTFRRKALCSAHRDALELGITGTDDASLVEQTGGRIVVVEGPRDNVKVTVPEDLALIQSVLNHRREGHRS